MTSMSIIDSNQRAPAASGNIDTSPILQAGTRVHKVTSFLRTSAAQSRVLAHGSAMLGICRRYMMMGIEAFGGSLPEHLIRSCFMCTRKAASALLEFEFKTLMRVRLTTGQSAKTSLHAC